MKQTSKQANKANIKQTSKQRNKQTRLAFFFQAGVHEFGPIFSDMSSASGYKYLVPDFVTCPQLVGTSHFQEFGPMWQLLF